MPEANQRIASAVLDVAWTCLKRDDGAKPTEYVVGIEFFTQLVRRLDAVLQWNDQRIGPHHRFDGPAHGRYLPAFDTAQNIVNHADLGGIVGGRNFVDTEITGDATDFQSLCTQRRQAFVARYEDNVLADLSKAPAEVSADTAAAINCNSHPASRLKNQVRVAIMAQCC